MKTLKYAWRFLMRSKSYTIINLLGLAFSLACSIILMRYIHRELTVDAHSVDPEHIIIPIRDIEGNLHPGSLQQGWSETDSVYIPDHQIVEQCRLMLQQRDNVVYENSNYAMNIAAVDSTFFHFFHYPVAAGEAHLDAPGDAIITQRYARNIFGKENPIGKVLEYYGKNITIKGVIGELGCKSLLRFDLLVSYRLVEHWQRMDISLMRILPGVDLDKINKASNVYRKDKRGNRIRWEFITWKNLYWRNSIGHDDDYDSIMQFGNRTHLYILSGVTTLLLLVGILNFINIYMVFMMKRSKEYGVKKVFGLQRLPLFLQIWIENLLLAFAALLTAWLLIEATQVPVSRLMNEQISYSAFDWQLSLGFIILLPLVTSIYPYIRYNYLPPIVSIRSITSNRHAITVRMTFLFFQYIITILLLILSFYFGKQLHFLLNTSPGYRTERILRAELLHENKNYLRSDTEEKRNERFARQDRIKQLLNECPHIEMWMNSHYSILRGGSICMLLNDQELEDAFVRSESPLWISVSEKGEMEEGGTKLMPVVAVIADYYPSHLTEGIKPMAFVVGPSSGNSDFLIAVNPDKEKEVIEYLKKTEKEIYNTEDFTYTWLTDEVHKLYAQDRQTANIYFVFALIAIIISCLGLFGLSLFDIRQRYREIAIRKVNGAGMKDFYLLLFRKYIKVIGCAFVLAIPLAYYLIYMYTRDFALKIPVDIGIYLTVLAIISFISSSTLIWQIHKAAQIDPAKIIRSE